MSALLFSVPQEEMSLDSQALPPLQEEMKISSPANTLQVHETSHRLPTIPGKFHKTVDPFEANGYL